MSGSSGRTRNTALNLLSVYGGEVLGLVLAFLLRTVFINTLGEEYLGINGIFSNILSILELSELGFGSAILYKMYAPIKNNDQLEINKYVHLYKTVYRLIGTFIMIAGVCLIPLLPMLIQDYDTFAELDLNPIIIFLLYLFQSVSSYWFFAYCSTVVEAHQKKYKLMFVGFFFSIASRICQILVLIFVRDYILYLAVVIFFIVIRNLTYAIISKRLFPKCFTKERNPITKGEVFSIFKDCFALMINKINTVAINATDSLVISSSLGLAYVGLYSNYLLFVTAIKSITRKFFHSITASLGNLHASGDAGHEYAIFKTINFITFWIYSVVLVGVTVIADDFIRVWIGDSFVVSTFIYKGVTIATPLALFIGIELYTHGIYEFTNLFRISSGIFQERKYVPLVAVVVNLVLSLALAQCLGILGVVIGTVVANLILVINYNSVVLFKKLFKIKIHKFYLKNILYFALSLGYTVLLRFIYGVIPLGGVIKVVVGIALCMVIPCGLNFIFFYNSPEQKLMLAKVGSLFLRKKGGKRDK